MKNDSIWKPIERLGEYQDENIKYRLNYISSFGGHEDEYFVSKRQDQIIAELDENLQRLYIKFLGRKILSYTGGMSYEYLKEKDIKQNLTFIYNGESNDVLSKKLDETLEQYGLDYYEFWLIIPKEFAGKMGSDHDFFDGWRVINLDFSHEQCIRYYE